MRIYNFEQDQERINPDELFMREALQLAQQAYDEGEIPIGAIVVCKGRVIGRGYNLTEKMNDITAHAEMQAITAASNYLGGKYLHDCVLYVTIEPCVMCTGALYWSQLRRVVYGAADPKRGSSLYAELYHPKTEVNSGILQEECASLITSFFRNKR